MTTMVYIPPLESRRSGSRSIVSERWAGRNSSNTSPSPGDDPPRVRSNAIALAKAVVAKLKG